MKSEAAGFGVYEAQRGLFTTVFNPPFYRRPGILFDLRSVFFLSAWKIASKKRPKALR